MNFFHAGPKSHAGGDEQHKIKFHWPYLILVLKMTVIKLRIKLNFIQMFGKIIKRTAYTVLFYTLTEEQGTTDKSLTLERPRSPGGYSASKRYVGMLI